VLTQARIQSLPSQNMAPVMSCVVAFLMLTVFSAESTQVTPVQKVLQMMSEMKVKGVNEMKAEEVTFTTFASWCQNTASQREKAIAKGELAMSQLAADIEKFNADAMNLGNEIQTLDSQIDAAEISMTNAKHHRSDENVQYKKDDQVFDTTIAELDDGAKLVKRMMASSPGASAASFIQKLASKPYMSGHAQRVLTSFLQSSSDSAAMSDAPEASEFQSQSGDIVGMIVSLEDKFGEEKQDNWREEMAEVQKFAMREQTLKDQIEQYTRSRNSKVSTKMAKEKASGAASAELAETTSVRDADDKYLADLKATCEQKTHDFTARQKLRGEELEAIDKAIEILGSAAASGAADTHLPSLAQQSTGNSLAQLRNGERQPSQFAAASFLKTQGQKFKSSTLAAIAVRVSQDPFKKVTKMIKDMVFKLQTEGIDEADHKGFCDTELATNKQTRDSLSANVDELRATIEGLMAKSNKLAADISALSDQIAELDAAVAEATAIRRAEKDKNTATITDAKAAITAVSQATLALKDFYAKAAGATALAQVAKGVADDMPQTFDKPYTGMAEGGVLGMLEVILSDFQRLEAETTSTEESSQAEFTVFSDDSQLDRATKAKDVEMKTADKQQTNSDTATNKNNLDSSQSQLDAAMKYFEQLKPSCVDAGLDYDDRVSRRNEEVQSLKEALQILTP